MTGLTWKVSVVKREALGSAAQKAGVQMKHGL